MQNINGSSREPPPKKRPRQ